MTQFLKLKIKHENSYSDNLKLVVVASKQLFLIRK